MVSARTPSGTINWAKIQRGRKTGAWQVLWPKTPVLVRGGKTVLKPSFVPAQRITQYTIAAFERFLEQGGSKLKSGSVRPETEPPEPALTSGQQPVTQTATARKPRPPGTVAFCPDCGDQRVRVKEHGDGYGECEGCHRKFKTDGPDYDLLLWKRVLEYRVSPCCATGRLGPGTEPRHHKCSACGREYSRDEIDWDKIVTKSEVIPEEQ
jgi:hypothetical protein